MNKDSLIAAKGRIHSLIHKTAILTSEKINSLAAAQLYFKCENFQKMGAFKMRGAANAICNLTSDQLRNGVVTHSSGNFAQAVSLSAKLLETKAYIVMPSTAPRVKQEAVKGYGGEITICEPGIEARQSAADKICVEKGATFLHPSNDIDVILGNATAAMELLEIHQDLDIIVCPVGGGGLAAGTALAAKHFGENCKVIAAEPYEADDAYRSLRSGKIESNKTANTIADGLRTTLGDINFPILQSHLDSVIRVQEEEIIAAMRLIWERMKIIIEPSCAVPLAAILNSKKIFKNKKVGVILSGGNVDLGNLPF